MENNFIYRLGKTSDIEQLQQLGLSSYGRFENVLTHEMWKQMAAGVSDENTYKKLLNTSQCFVCEAGKKIVGMAFLVPSGNPTDIFTADWSYIRLLGVDPAYEGKGIGRKLTQLCIENARKNGEEIIALHTSEIQNAARHIYESLGFEMLREIDPIFNKKYFLYQMPLKNTSGSITFHRAKVEDVATLVEYRIRFLVEFAGAQPPHILEHLKKQMTNYFSKTTAENKCISFIAKSGEKTAGIGTVHVRELPANLKNPSGKWGYIMNIYTVPEYRRRGVCTGILNEIKKAATEMGIGVLELHATEQGEAVFSKMGYKLHDEPMYRLFL